MLKSYKEKANFTENYEGVQVYVHSRTYLFGERGGPTIELPAGEHKYNYSYQLPDNLPSSLNISYGEIFYHIKVVLDIPWAFDEEIKVPLWILARYDLNLYPELKSPKEFETFERITPIFGSSHDISMVVKVPFTGWVSEQIIPIEVGYENASNVNIKKTTIKLMRLITYTDQEGCNQKLQSYCVMKHHIKGAVAEATTYRTTNIQIPGIGNLMSNGMFCKVMKIEYFVVVVGKISWVQLLGKIGSNPEIRFPVTIGNVELRSVEPQILQGDSLDVQEQLRKYRKPFFFNSMFIIFPFSDRIDQPIRIT